jgi:hypothetical protein
VAGSNSATHLPADVTVTSSPGAFGNTGGVVTLDGVTISTTSYTDTEVQLSMSGLAAALTDPWGLKSIVVTPNDTAKPPTRVPFTCRVPASVATTINASTSAATVAAGTAYTTGYSTSGFIGSNAFAPAAGASGYEYVTAADHASSGWDVRHEGIPAAAGEYRVRVALSRATYATERYAAPTVSDVSLTITGLPVTVTPHSDNGASFTYQGQLTDGTAGSPTDVHWTATTTADPITKVVWEYRNATCTTGDWTEGLPKDVAIAPSGCGGDDTTRSQWDVRVRSFEMTTTGTDRAPFYLGTFPSTRIQINPKSVTITGARADRGYDGTTTATVGELTVTGAVAGETLTLDDGSVSASFASAAPGVDRPVTLAHAVELAGVAERNYTLTNPTPTIIGTITKARLSIALAAAPPSLLMTALVPSTVTATVHDTATGSPPDGGAGVPAEVLVSQTPGVCSISGTTVTATAAGTCVIAGTVAASTNYTAATAASDPSSSTETVAISVFAAPRTISVVADDREIAVDEGIYPSAQVTGLFDGDELGDVGFDYYQNGVLLGSEPTAPGSYRIMPRDGSLNAADTGAYANPTAFAYVAGTLVITPAPPTITRMTPPSGPVAGGTLVTITGARLDTVRGVRIGAVTLRVGSFTVNGAGTTLTFRTPAVGSARVVTVTLLAGTASAEDLYTYVGTPSSAPVRLKLALDLKVDTKVVGAHALLTGGGLRPGSAYTLVMHSAPVTVTSGITDSGGRFSRLVTMPGRACVAGGLHRLILTGIAPNGSVVRDSKWIVLDDACTARAVSATAPGSTALELKWFLFDRLSARLSAEDKAALRALVPALRGAETVTVTGYTQTQNTSLPSIIANRILAMKRATAVADYLRSRGVTARIVKVGKGPVDPVSRADQRLNRRVVVGATY